MAHTPMHAQAAKFPPAERIELMKCILDSLDQPGTSMDLPCAKEVGDPLALTAAGAGSRRRACQM